MRHALRPIAALVVLLSLGLPAQAEVFGGVDFPQGAISFADAVASYDPVIKSDQPGPAYRDPFTALGAPDYDGGDGEYVSLGDGGSITLRFVDNALTGSDSDANDLWIFEIGPDVEDTFVEISGNGATWFSVGKVTGSTRGIDIDAFGYGANTAWRWVRLTDDGNEGGQSGATVGADIDAIGAISTTAVPEPSTWALLGLGLAALGCGRRRAATQ